MKKLIKDLINLGERDYRKINKLKKEYAKRNSKKLPLNSEILASATKKNKEKLIRLLKTKPTRTLSGVSVIAIMTPPKSCPGKCIYCPQGENAPKSYTGYEPAAMRAQLNNFNAFKQVQNRLNQLKSTGHNTSKNELIIMGGTFPSLPWNFQKKFIKGAFSGFNNQRSKTLRGAHKINETTANRVIGLTIETRPDWVVPKKLLRLGGTRVELGVQTVFPSILKEINRGHDVATTVKATKDLKNSAFKIMYHIMPGLPGSNFGLDLKMFKKIFSEEKFKPDMLKIYPCLVIKGTKLYDMWKKGVFNPIDEEYMMKLLKKVYEICPKWVRIMRVQRDIPAPHIEAGPKKSNLRQEVLRRLKSSKEIRFREAGHSRRLRHIHPKRAELIVEKYRASGGVEYFISMEDVDQDILLGFCRLRISSRKEAMIRELHVYDSVIPIGKKSKKVQHKGFGKKMMKKAEQLALKAGKKEMIVISGVGVREYYQKLGYKLRNRYMWKAL